MIQGVLLLFLAYLTPGFELNTTLVDTISIEKNKIEETEIIKNTKDLERVKKVLGKDINFPATYFVDEVLILKQLARNEDPQSVRVINTKKYKDGGYRVTYTAAAQENPPDSGAAYMVLKVKPVAQKNSTFDFVKVGADDPVFVDQSIEERPAYTSVQTQPRELVFHHYFPLDKGNSWTYLKKSGNDTSTFTSSIVSFTKGWSVFDNFFGKKRVALQMDLEGNLMTSSKDGIKTFYTESVKIEKSKQPFSVEAGTFTDLIVVSIPKNSSFWFRDIYAKGVGLIYHEHTSPRGSAVYKLRSAKIRGKSIP